MAQGSLSELDTQLEIALNLGYIDDEQRRDLDGSLDRIDKMLTGLIRSQRP
jgi:four helix bundle protein